MKNIKIKFAIIFLTIFFFGLSAPVYADTAIHLTIKTSANTFYDQDITVTPCNSDNNVTTSVDATAYCAIIQSGIQNDWNWTWAPGAFLNSLNNVAGFTTEDENNNPVYHYWDWSLNGTEASTGLNEYDLQPNDLILLNFVDPNSTSAPSGGGPILESATPVLPADSPASITPIATPVPSIPPPVFSVPNAINYLKSMQGMDGSFGESDLYTDWAAVALGADNVSGTPRDSLLSYFNSHSALSSLLTDNERHAMALLALGQNPYSFNGTDYISAIVKSFDGAQFGDPSLVNDDIFALIPLESAGYTASDNILSEDIQFIISKQLADGSWDESVDLTAAAIQMLKSFDSIAGVSEVLSKASDYLINAQNSDGGWNNISSTSWAMQAASVLGTLLTKNGHNGLDYLAANQAADGATLAPSETVQNRIWATSYAIPAALGKPWSAILRAVPKPVPPAVVAIAPKIIKNNTPVGKELTANVINTTTNEVNSAPIKKESWVQTLFRWLFGF